ncbi:hypothetical protein [Allobranchiibius huperziae]|uniref:Uncharacterized protein n=1 Tax=Allobranchiibius huperziae TaxID=1874116 RepID=A0A853DG44_9MICO|nr:hypothetical protein [Allobranchiibius huperziae]NYJ76506.1 hypothetical protein [Allobranchiibius huperziae]
MRTDLTAWGDESMRSAHVSVPIYSMAAAVVKDGDCADLRGQMSALWPRPGKLHWRDQTDQERDASIKVVASLELAHVAVVSGPLDGRRQERARAKTLETLAWELNRRSVTSLTLEKRTPSQARRDELLVAQMRGSKVITTDLRVSFARGSEEPLLWIADQVLGAMGEAAVGNLRWSERLEGFIQRIDVELD